ncbi:hypothetical protein E2C01_094693 [Portunus trituberculatus]|uniref:Uncharacterized protein n=1 Tax=Portunus trituberculatus TaxID=210409 RepID=A0A5B7K2C5_PORTR|nr:hypothetical protein [Portunus trituberculatus]
MFGAFFGLGFSKFVTRSMILMPHPKASSTATSDTFSMIGEPLHPHAIRRLPLFSLLRC